MLCASPVNRQEYLAKKDGKSGQYPILLTMIEKGRQSARHFEGKAPKKDFMLSAIDRAVAIALFAQA